MRVQDAVPDELEIIHDSGDSRPSSSTSQQDSQSSLHGKHSPHAGIDKVGSEWLGHGDVPGTAANSERKAYALSDIVSIDFKKQQYL